MRHRGCSDSFPNDTSHCQHLLLHLVQFSMKMILLLLIVILCTPLYLMHSLAIKQSPPHSIVHLTQTPVAFLHSVSDYLPKITFCHTIPRAPSRLSNDRHTVTCSDECNPAEWQSFYDTMMTDHIMPSGIQNTLAEHPSMNNLSPCSKSDTNALHCMDPFTSQPIENAFIMSLCDSECLRGSMDMLMSDSTSVVLGASETSSLRKILSLSMVLPLLMYLML